MRKDLEEELKTLELMMEIYCLGRHGGKKLCAGCSELLSYAAKRLEKCPHCPKPACKNCPVHCYAPAKREQMREAMKYAGPRMPLRHPLLALKHYFRK